MNIIGLCIGEFCSAALVIDGLLAGAGYEDRFHRKKYLSGFPVKAIDYLLKANGLKINDVNKIMVMNETDSLLETALVQRLHSFHVDDFIKEAHDYYKPLLLENKPVDYLKVFKDQICRDVFPHEIRDRIIEEGETRENSQEIRRALIQKVLCVKDVDIRFVEHHYSHALYGLLFVPNKAENYLIFTADSFGDYSNANVFRFSEAQLKRIHSSSDQNLGRLFRNITLLLGLKPYQDELKVMGLAPYASTKYSAVCHDIFASFMTGFRDGEWQFKKTPKDHYFTFRELLEGQRFDSIAGGLQSYFEQMLSQWFEYYIRENEDCDTVVFSGGLSMNVKANLVLEDLAHRYGKTFFAAPSGNDFSHCISVAFVGLLDNHNDPSHPVSLGVVSSLNHGYEFEQGDINRVSNWALEKGWRIEKLDLRKIAEKLKEGSIFALCHHKAEFGERALGFRSIIADPSENDTIHKINIAIKKRDFWMPFAATILKEYAQEYLDFPDMNNHHFMAAAARTTNVGAQKLKAAIHPYDHSSRPQILERKSNELFYDIIHAFGELTGTYALLNTSLNLHGYPIVNNGEDLIFVLENSGLNGCILEDRLIIGRN